MRSLAGSWLWYHQTIISHHFYSLKLKWKTFFCFSFSIVYINLKWLLDVGCDLWEWECEGREGGETRGIISDIMTTLLLLQPVIKTHGGAATTATTTQEAMIDIQSCLPCLVEKLLTKKSSAWMNVKLISSRDKYPKPYLRRFKGQYILGVCRWHCLNKYGGQESFLANNFLVSSSLKCGCNYMVSW